MTGSATSTTAAVAAGSAVAATEPVARDEPAAWGPTSFDLPTGFRPEGTDIGPGGVAHLGSLGGGQLLRADLRTGGTEVSSGAVGTPAVGLEPDDRGPARREGQR